LTGYVRDSIKTRSDESLQRCVTRVAERYKSGLPASTEQSANYFPAYACDPVGFIQTELRYPSETGSVPVRLWSRQRTLVESVRDHDQTSCRTGQKVGKTILVAAIALWWVLSRPRGLAILTSASDTQVKTQIWKELKTIWDASGGNARFLPQAPLAVDPSTGLRIDNQRSIYGFTTNQAERMAGFSGDQILFCIDEASGFPEEQFEAVIGNMMGGGRCLATGNPTKASGWFFRSFHDAAGSWARHHIAGTETPNCTGDEEPIPGLADPDRIAKVIAEFGADSPVVDVRVHGRFPAQSTDSVVGLGLIEGAKERHETGKPTPGRLEVGVDVARFGTDDSAIACVRGLWGYPLTTVHGYDSVEVAAKVVETVTLYRHEGDELPLVKVDSSGGWGSGVIDILARRTDMLVVPVDAGSGSTVLNRNGERKFVRLRDELWWAVRSWLERGGALPPDSKEEAELMCPTYGHDVALRILVEDKKALKKKLKRSPDRADARCLAVWQAPDLSAAIYRPREQTRGRSRVPRPRRGRVA